MIFLYDACLVPNIGIEIAYTDSWSVSANWMYADWQNNQRPRMKVFRNGEEISLPTKEGDSYKYALSMDAGKKTTY